MKDIVRLLKMLLRRETKCYLFSIFCDSFGLVTLGDNNNKYNMP